MGVGYQSLPGHQGVLQDHFPLWKASLASPVSFSSSSQVHCESQTNAKCYPFLGGPLVLRYLQKSRGEYSLRCISVLAVKLNFMKQKVEDAQKDKKEVLPQSILWCHYVTL